MSKNTCVRALEDFKTRMKEENPDFDIAQCEVVKLLRADPLIDKMDPCLNELVNCKKLSLSTNIISAMIDLRGFKNLEILSLGRNNIKVIKGLDAVGATLKELWMSYNQIEKLDGLQACQVLEKLYLTNNKIKNWDELDKLNSLPNLIEVSFGGNPIYEQVNNAKVPNNAANFAMAPGRATDFCRITVLKKCPQLKTIDTHLITEQLLEQANAE